MSSKISDLLLESIQFRFRNLKQMGDRTLAQVSAEQLIWRSGEFTNSIAVIIQHISGNMKSRWTEFLNSDGEKIWRDRDGEFSEPGKISHDEAIQIWEEGWDCLFQAIESLNLDDLERTVQIRGQEIGVIDAINRQLSHYSYHIGQLVHITKEQLGENWQTLSIPRGQSTVYKPMKRD